MTTIALQPFVEAPSVSANATPPAPLVASPTSRLARFIDSAATLNEAQTISALRGLDLRPLGIETKLQRHVLLARFAELDPQTALTYVDTLSGTERDEQTTNVLTTWANRAPQAAAEHFQINALSSGIASTEDRDTAAAIAAEWARRDPGSALQWAATLPEEVRSEARARIIARLTATNPAVAAQLAATLPAGYERAEAMKPLAAQWAQSSPNQAATWIQSLTTPAEQANAAAGLVSTWMSSNPMAASQWVGQLKPGAARDAAIVAMVQSQSLNNDPEAATLWASSIQEPALRRHLVSQAARTWQMHDPDAAQAWLASTVVH